MNNESLQSSATSELADRLPKTAVDASYGWNVAKAQKALLLAALLEIAVMVPTVGWVFYIIGVLLSYWAVYKIGEALQVSEDGFSSSGGGKWLMLLWIPYVGVITIFVLNSKATKFLKEAGYEVGLFGARKRKIDSST